MKKICIDIGHAAGTGATGNGLEEHGVAVQIAAHLARYLAEREGISIRDACARIMEAISHSRNNKHSLSANLPRTSR